MSDSHPKTHPKTARRDPFAPAAILETHDFWLYDLAFAPDSLTLAVGTKRGRGVSLFRTTDWTRRAMLDDVAAPPSDLAFCPDGSALTLTTDTAPVRVWEAASGRLRWKQSGHSPIVRFSPDGQWLVAARKGTAQFLASGNGEPGHLLAGHKQDLTGLAFTSDGELLATSDRRSLCFWDVASGRLLRRVQVRTPLLARMAFAPGSRSLTALDYAGTLRVWEAADGKERPGLQAQANTYERLAWSRDGRRLVTCGAADAAAGSDEVRVWDIFDRKQLLSLRLPGARGFLRPAIAPDGAWVAALAEAPGRPLVVWPLATPADAVVLPLPDEGGRVAFSPDGHWLAVATHDGKTRVWDVRAEAGFLPQAQPPARPAQRRTTPASVPAPPEAELETEADKLARKPSSPPADFTLALDLHPFVFSPDGVTFVGAQDGLHLFDTTSWKARAPIALPGTVRHLAFQPRGAGLAAATTAGCFFWTKPTERETWLLPGTGRHVAFAKDGLGAAFAATKSVLLVEVATGQPKLEAKPFRKEAEWVDLSPSGQFLAASSWTQVLLWRLPDGRPTALQDKAGRVLGIAFSPREDLLAVTTQSGLIRLWDAPSQRLRHEIQTDADAAFAISFSPDGRLLAASGLTGQVRVWDVTSARSVACLGEPSEAITHAAFSPDGQWLVTAEEYPAHRVSLWSTRTWQPAARIQTVPYAAQVTVSPDNRWLAVKVHEAVRLWDLKKLLRTGR